MKVTVVHITAEGAAAVDAAVALLTTLISDAPAPPQPATLDKAIDQQLERRASRQRKQ